MIGDISGATSIYIITGKTDMRNIETNPKRVSLSFVMVVVQKVMSAMYCQTALVPARWDGARPEQTE